MVDLIQFALILVCLGLAGWAILTRRRISGVSPRPTDPIKEVLDELLARSRSSGGNVHIHDVEEVVRRHLG